jgi:hypothetical protein
MIWNNKEEKVYLVSELSYQIITLYNNISIIQNAAGHNTIFTARNLQNSIGKENLKFTDLRSDYKFCSSKSHFVGDILV